MDDFDHYKEAKTLISMLHKTSLDNYGEMLQKAMDEGSTGTEIFMALRWALEKLLNEADCRDIIRGKTKRLLDEINNALK